MASRGNDHRGFVFRVLEAKMAYKGPFTGRHVEAVLLEAGYSSAFEHDDDSLLIFAKEGCMPVPLNSDWDEMYDNHPTFRCLCRDLGMSRGQLRTRLNEVRMATG